MRIFVQISFKLCFCCFRNKYDSFLSFLIIATENFFPQIVQKNREMTFVHTEKPYHIFENIWMNLYGEDINLAVILRFWWIVLIVGPYNGTSSLS